MARTRGDNPWGSPGYEWDTASPPPNENFDHDVVITATRTPIRSRGRRWSMSSSEAHAAHPATRSPPQPAPRAPLRHDRGSRTTRSASGCGSSSAPRCCFSPASSSATASTATSTTTPSGTRRRAPHRPGARRAQHRRAHHQQLHGGDGRVYFIKKGRRPGHARPCWR